MRTGAPFGANAARAEAKRTSQMNETFLATLSHELRTPLSAIFRCAQVLQHGTRDAADLARFKVLVLVLVLVLMLMLVLVLVLMLMLMLMLIVDDGADARADQAHLVRL